MIYHRAMLLIQQGFELVVLGRGQVRSKPVEIANMAGCGVQYEFHPSV